MNEWLLVAAAVDAVMPAAIATGLFTGLATFQSSDAADWPDGFYSGDYQNLPGLTEIACVDAPESEGSIVAGEAKTTTTVTDSAVRHVLLDSFYLTLDAGWRAGWRVVLGRNDGSGNLIDGVNYDLIGVESDSQATQTRIRATRVTI